MLTALESTWGAVSLGYLGLGGQPIGRKELQQSGHSSAQLAMKNNCVEIFRLCRLKEPGEEGFRGESRKLSESAHSLLEGKF